MVRKTVAVFILLLAASPFTAPFATCDVVTLFGGQRSTNPQGLVVAATVEGEAQEDADLRSTKPGRRRVSIELVARAHADALPTPPATGNAVLPLTSTTSIHTPDHASLAALRI